MDGENKAKLVTFDVTDLNNRDWRSVKYIRERRTEFKIIIATVTIFCLKHLLPIIAIVKTIKADLWISLWAIRWFRRDRFRRIGQRCNRSWEWRRICENIQRYFMDCDRMYCSLSRYEIGAKTRRWLKDSSSTKDFLTWKTIFSNTETTVTFNFSDVELECRLVQA